MPARLAFFIWVATGTLTLVGVEAGLAALAALAVLAVLVPNTLAGVELLATAGWIAVTLIALKLVLALLLIQIAWRRWLGDFIRTGRFAPTARSKRSSMVEQIRSGLERVTATGIVIAHEVHQPVTTLILATISTAGALVAADVLLRRWLRFSQRRRPARAPVQP
jgi:hypothetical protein